MVQGDEGALTGNAIAKSGVVRAPDELRPVTVNDGGPRLHERIFDVIQKCWVLIEIGDCDGFQLEALARKVRVDELLNLAIGRIGSVDGGEICEDGGWRLVCRFVDEGLLVCVEFGDVDGLKELWWIGSKLDSLTQRHGDPSGTHRSGAEYLTGTPWLGRWEGCLGR